MENILSLDALTKPKKLFPCENCDKIFTQQAHLSIHERKHSGERPFVCSFLGCGKSFTQLGNLKTHERKHTGERPFECSFLGCEKSFSQMGNMKTHEQLHFGIKSFNCEYPNCLKSFTQLGNLKSHTRKLHTHPKKIVLEAKVSKIPLRKRKTKRYRMQLNLDLQSMIKKDVELSFEERLLFGIKAVVAKSNCCK